MTRGAALVVGASLALALPVSAQDLQRDGVSAAAGFSFEPTMAVLQGYDSNLFAADRSPQADFVTRIQPALKSAFRTAVWHLAARASFDLERFSRHSELTSADAGHDLAADVEYRPTRRLTVAAGGGLAKTLTPSDLSTLTGLVFARTPATRLSAQTSVRTQVHRLTAGRIEYRFTDDRLAGATRIQSHAATVGVDHRRASREIVTLEARLQAYDFESASESLASLNVRTPTLERSGATSAAIVAGWTYTLGHGVSVSLDGGPRVTDGSLAPEIAVEASLQRRFHYASLLYARTQAPLLGFPGVATAQSVTGTTGWRLRRTLDLVVSPSLVRTTLGPWRADSGRLSIEVARPIATGVSIVCAGAAGLQRGNLNAGRVFDTIGRNEIMLKVIAERPRPEVSTDVR